MYPQQHYLWSVLCYQCQTNQALHISLITYICQSLYPHISRVCPGVNFSKCPPTCPRRKYNPVIKYGKSSNCTSILRDSVESTRTYFHALDRPGISREDEKNRQSRYCIKRGFVTFTFLFNKHVVSFYRGHLYH